MEESKCPIQNDAVDEVSKKLIDKERLVPAGQEDIFQGNKKARKKLPTEGMYSEKTKIYSPMSRGF